MKDASGAPHAVRTKPNDGKVYPLVVSVSAVACGFARRSGTALIVYGPTPMAVESGVPLVRMSVRVPGIHPAATPAVAASGVAVLRAVSSSHVLNWPVR